MGKTLVIGGGIAGLSAASYLAKHGKDVLLIEKNDSLGGRARSFTAKGFTFDMGPSWYWMPDIFEKFYNNFGYSASDFYTLIRLDPSYQIFFSDGDKMQLSASYEKIEALFEKYETGSARKLKLFLKSAKYKYEVGVGEFVYKPGHSIREFLDWRLMKQAIGLKLLSSISSEIRSLFKHPKLIQLLEFPVLFLGAKPENTPALYSLMNYSDIVLGTWYPNGGMHKIVEGMTEVARSLGVNFHTSEPVREVRTRDAKVFELITDKNSYPADAVISSADYHHTEFCLLSEEDRSYSEAYWENREMAPSSLVFYLGIGKKVKGLLHHNLFFDADFKKHSEEIYDSKVWPKDPLFYVCCPSKTDPSVAPESSENIFILVPLAPGLKDSETMREELFGLVLERIERRTGESIKENIIYKRSYCLNNFDEDYNSFKGNAYGLANTLRQTAFLKPKIRSKKVKNLFYAGQLTTPGPGLPPSIISGEVAAKELIKAIR